MDRLNPTIAELTQAIEQEVEKCPEARRLMTHPGVGAFDRTGLRADPRQSRARFGSGKRVASYLGLVPLEEFQWQSTTTGPHHRQTGEFDCDAFFAGGSGAGRAVRSVPEWRSKYLHLMMRRGEKNRQGRDGPQAGGSAVLDDAQGMGLRAVEKVRSLQGRKLSFHTVLTKGLTR